MKTLIITGATGFIGQHIVKQALNKGYKVIASVRSSSNTQWLEENNIPIVIFDLSNPTKLLNEIRNTIKIYGEIDVVIHNAGLTQSLKPKDYYDVNVDLTKNLIKALIETGNKTPKFIYVSSIAALGPGDSITFNPISENQIPHPVTHYGKSKLLAEEFIINQKDLLWIIIRPTVVYGEGEKNFFNVIRTINSGLEFYAGSKKQMLSLVYVEDLAEAIILLAESNKHLESFNISDGLDYPITEINRIIKSALSKKTISIVVPFPLLKIIALINEVLSVFSRNAPILNIDKLAEFRSLNWICDNSKLKNELKFEPRIKFEEGITKTIKWNKQNGGL